MIIITIIFILLKQFCALCKLYFWHGTPPSLSGRYRYLKLKIIKKFSLSFLSVWPKLTFRANYHVFGFCLSFQQKKLQKVWHFVKNHQNLLIWPKLAISRANYHVFGFCLCFQQKVAKSMAFCEKPLKLVDLAKQI